MRVTNRMMTEALLSNLDALRLRQASVSNQISSGSRISKVSEDPTAAGQTMRVQSRMQVMEQWESGAADARVWLRSADAAFDQMTGLLSRIKELAIAGANTAVGDEARTAIAPEVKQLQDELLTVLNSRSLGGALFAGFRTDAEPFALDPITGAILYSGDSGEMRRDIGPGITISANLHGDRIADWADPDNPLTAVWQLVRDLEHTDHVAVSAGLNRFDKAIDRVLSLRSELGNRERRVDQAENRMRDTFVYLSELLEQAQGTDMARAILELTGAETTYRAAMQVGARILPPTLADFLR